MKLKERLVYNATTDDMVGFVDLGSSRNKKDDESLATHALQFYIRSITGGFSRPLAFYGTSNTTADKLANMVWQSVACLENIGLHVIAVIADGASCNRKTFDLLNNQCQDIPYRCINIYNPSHPLFLISDPPHLLKTTCNNIRSSKPGGSRLLKYGSHFQKVPRLFESSELRCSKLTNAHFCNQSFAKMRVQYAAQLLSGSVSRLMKARGGDEILRSSWICELMNRWFDCMNARRDFGHNKDLQPFTDKDDQRLTWLTDVFLSELKTWKDGLHGSSSEKAKIFLSFQTYQGLVSTTKAVVELTRFMLDVDEEGISISTRQLNQDPLEAYFGHMRQTGRRCEAPDRTIFAVREYYYDKKGHQVLERLKCEVQDYQLERSKSVA